MTPQSARSPRRGFVWALAASLALHLLTLALAPRLPGEASATGPALIEVRLAQTSQPAAAPLAVLAPGATVPPAAPTAAAAPSAAPSAAPAAQRGAGRPPPSVQAAATRAPAAAVTSDTSAATTAMAAPALPEPPLSAAAPADGHAAGATGETAAEPTLEPGPQAVTDGPDTVVDPPATAATVEGPAEGGASQSEAPADRIVFPRHGRLEYAVTIGEPPTPVGRAIYTWSATATTYRLSLSAMTTGFVGLVRRVRVEQISEGRITRDGLRPDAFRMNRGPDARNEFADFDWPAKQLTFGYPDARQSGVIAEGVQDILSLILQFAFVPIVEGQREVLLTTGRKLYRQSYEMVGEEVIVTTNGAWRAWHLRRVRAEPGDEGYDMWLASGHPYLPVRIRWTDRRGRITSATVDTVRMSED